MQLYTHIGLQMAMNLSTKHSNSFKTTRSVLTVVWISLQFAEIVDFSMDINTLTIVDNIMTANFSPSVFSAAMYFDFYSHDEKLYLKLKT